MFVQLIISMLLTKSLKIGTVLSTALLNQPFYKLEMSRIFRHINFPAQGSYLRYQIQNISSASVEGIITKSSEEVNHIWPAMLLLIKATNALDAKHYRCRPSYM